MSSLALMKEGETGQIVDVRPRGGCHRRHRHGCDPHARHFCIDSKEGHSHEHLENMGLRSGKQVEMIMNNGAGPLVLRVDECRIAMGRGAAMKIYVRRIEK